MASAPLALSDGVPVPSGGGGRLESVGEDDELLVEGGGGEAAAWKPPPGRRKHSLPQQLDATGVRQVGTPRR